MQGSLFNSLGMPSHGWSKHASKKRLMHSCWKSSGTSAGSSKNVLPVPGKPMLNSTSSDIANGSCCTSSDLPGWSPNIHHLGRTARTACPTVEDLYLMWQDGENKLRRIISFIHSERASMKDDGRSSAHADAHECSDDEPDAGEPAWTSAQAAQKQRRRRKSKKTKGRGKK